MSIKNLVKLKEVTEDNAEFLYEMLKERDSTVNVTHQKLPLNLFLLTFHKEILHYLLNQNHMMLGTS